MFLWIQWSFFQLLLPWQLAAAYGFGCTVLHAGREQEGVKAAWRVGLGVIPYTGVFRHTNTTWINFFSWRRGPHLGHLRLELHLCIWFVNLLAKWLDGNIKLLVYSRDNQSPLGSRSMFPKLVCATLMLYPGMVQKRYKCMKI